VCVCDVYEETCVCVRERCLGGNSSVCVCVCVCVCVMFSWKAVCVVCVMFRRKQVCV